MTDELKVLFLLEKSALMKNGDKCKRAVMDFCKSDVYRDKLRNKKVIGELKVQMVRNVRAEEERSGLC